MTIVRRFGAVWVKDRLPDKLPKLQNRTFRITHENYETRTADVLNKAGLPDLKSRREYQLAVLMFKIKKKRYQTL